MGDFFPNQRYTSTGEPELGLGIVTEVSKGRVQIYFPLADETRLYASENAPLNRVVFKVGNNIVDNKGQSIVIEKIQFEDQLYNYYGNGKKLLESEIADGSVTHSVDDRLFMGDVDSPELFALRRDTLYHNYNRRISPVHGFVGAKIDLIPHQLYIAHEVSSRFAPRVLLSDQVGLGKTIEACLILHRMLITGRASRALILVPDSLVHQWFVELLRKFGLWFNIFDEERCISLEESAPDGNPFLDDQLVICSIDFLANSQKRSQQAISANWDLLIVDEAHHLEWSVNDISPEYAIVELLCHAAKGLLLLTATPEQLGVESHFARLRLLDPNRYNNLEDFLNEAKDQKNIAAVVEKLFNKTTLNQKDYQLLETLFPKERISALAKNNDTTTNNLIEDLLDQHGPGRVVFRNTRLAMRGFPKRITHLAPIEVEENREQWLERASQEFEFDRDPHLKTTKEQDFWFDNDPRVKWVLQKMKAVYPEKIVLICTSKEKVQALEAAIVRAINLNVSVFHEDLTLVQRDRNAAWFAEHDSAQILLCSEIGSEGRNFQFVHHLILFDVPFHPELLEQRIGRLDRIGQKNDIHIHVPYLVESPQEILVRWYHEGLNAFTTNLEGGNLISKVFKERLTEIILLKKSKNISFELDQLIAETVSFHEKLKKNLTEGRDRLLEMNSFRPKIAQQLIQKIKSEDKDATLENYLTKVFHHFNVEMEDLAPRTYLLHPTSHNSEVFPSIPLEGIQVSFDRKRALSREDMSFLSWDHPMVTGAIDMVLGSTLGNASYAIMKGMGTPALVIEFIFVLETAGKQNNSIDRYLPQAPLRIVVDHSGKEVTENYSVEFFNKNLKTGNVNRLLENDALVDSILPNMISSATEIAKKIGINEIAKGVKQMTLKLDHEIDRLVALQKNNGHIRADEIQTAIEERNQLATLIKNARVRLDALQLIRIE